MPSFVQMSDYTPDMLDEIMFDLTEPCERRAVVGIIGLFADAGLKVKVRHVFPKSEKDYFRVICFVKKSTESVLINTRNDSERNGVFNGLNIQVRIADTSLFNRLDGMPESIRDTFINANNCNFCTPKCDGKRYTFTYGGTQYTKCQYLCSNFRFKIHTDVDADALMGIVSNEIERGTLKQI